MEVKMDLKKELIAYINHKIVLSRVSKWYTNLAQNNAIKMCYADVRLFQHPSFSMGTKQLAKYVLDSEKRLYNILPNPNNKSYKSSVETYYKILNYSKELLTPKISQTNEELKF